MKEWKLKHNCSRQNTGPVCSGGWVVRSETGLSAGRPDGFIHRVTSETTARPQSRARTTLVVHRRTFRNRKLRMRGKRRRRKNKREEIIKGEAKDKLYCGSEICLVSRLQFQKGKMFKTSADRLDDSLRHIREKVKIIYLHYFWTR